MHINWSQVWDYLYGNRLPILATLGLFVTATVKTMPDPSQPWNWVEIRCWFYDFAHQYLNITNTRLKAPPENTASPK